MTRRKPTLPDTSRWRPILKVQVAKETPFLGPGARELLTQVEATGSVRVACQKMGLSYSKAWKILNNLEEQVGFQVLARQQGGKHGGKTSLTPEGQELLRGFDRFQRECKQAVEAVFRRHYGGEV